MYGFLKNETNDFGFSLINVSLNAISVVTAALYIRHFGNESSCKQSKNPILIFQFNSYPLKPSLKHA